MTLGTAGRGDGTALGTTAAGMTGGGMAAIAIIHGLIGDVPGAATMDGIITTGTAGMAVIMDITIMATTDVVMVALPMVIMDIQHLMEEVQLI